MSVPTRIFDLKAISANFAIDGCFTEAIPYGNGHIHDTFLASFMSGTTELKYIFQRINTNIFKTPEKVMENIQRVTSHLKKQIVAQGGDPLRETLNVVLSHDNRSFFVSPEGHYWRAYLFIDKAKTYDIVLDGRHIYNASRAFGFFQRRIADLPGDRLFDVLPDFHNTEKRFVNFTNALAKDAKNRAQSVKTEVAFVLAREKDAKILCGLLRDGKIPERITHNDTKFNNVMIDDVTGEGICVIDLDTVMPGLVLYDFGDSVRIGASTAAEDEKDLSKVGVDLGLFDRLAAGYLDAVRGFLTPVELEYLAFSAKLLTFECGMRFLTDYIEGDTYFKIKHPEHNIDRCRTQLKMVADMEEKMGKMEEIVEKFK
ncbi:MAG: mucin desulfatase [Candidatus Raymondbacteria bacterium RifOxyA12_full_50_37]|uniref:Mucin desulfatase n=1 Tax=Candidatus Raymondbacteria bacterium RIFOXYD12_FULL_49_13 TaxID=1817890 RepID=A0A1F7F945_UNCRA|nr:MAG: mucin desulfatase [Candidatus Raymondbacteria bacterium RifOxyA12_full_50_37]OGJ85411.1 MAG: mucin desulfatase [Candidatus Raymondbacteria bacterium RIFOXYA2_FULL_49_16]OGJ86135.1 MAG: mucin desulfatase [Candidatus Raymondbacteria bacterium RifOxyB12_full_50_8]OGJ94919.1 MAG: mucin desulfatase [Candidatus Raymondbacteria bacterium RIFOXYC2_FULL_50_21]OGJ98677.1 MAG: mucin desulfatase [Candidatus Raymondbacteria bacterium RifOxyC12_full_50_8]OGK03036.1 MAG: mucin desulfatase [Candidatus